MTDNAASGFFVTTGSFSKGARKFVRNGVPIELVDGSGLLKMMEEAATKA
jgi:restriction endonuclease Mrr